MILRGNLKTTVVFSFNNLFALKPGRLLLSVLIQKVGKEIKAVEKSAKNLQSKLKILKLAPNAIQPWLRHQYFLNVLTAGFLNADFSEAGDRQAEAIDQNPNRNPFFT